MAQLIYGTLGLLVAVLFATSLNTAVHTNRQRTYTNEVLSQTVGIGGDVLGEVGRRGLPFDEAVDEERYEGPIQYPLVHVAWELTPESEFGGCTDPSLCLDLDDFHGMVQEHEVEGLHYKSEISVTYVDERYPEQELDVQSFAKKVTVTITSDAIQIGGEPLTVSYSRVFTYERSTVDPPSSIV